MLTINLHQTPKYEQPALIDPRLNPDLHLPKRLKQWLRKYAAAWAFLLVCTLLSALGVWCIHSSHVEAAAACRQKCSTHQLAYHDVISGNDHDRCFCTDGKHVEQVP